MPEAPDLYYDPYDFEIDADPYPDLEAPPRGAPLYRNETLRLLRR